MGHKQRGKCECAIETMIPERDLDESRVGVRFSTQIGRWDISLMDYYTHNMSPTIDYEGTSWEVRREIGDDGTGKAVWQNNNYYIPKVRLKYERQNILGLSFNYFESALTKGVIKGEVAYYNDKPYNTYDRELWTEKDTISYALVWEKGCFMPWLHPDDPNETVFVSFQLFQDIILEDDDGLHVGPYLTDLDKVSTRLTLKTFTCYVKDVYHPEIIAAYDPEGNGMVRGTPTFNPPWTEKYKVDLIYVNYWGDQYENLGLFKEKDSVFLRLRYTW